MIIRGWLCELARTRDVTASHVEPIPLHPPLRNLRHGQPPFRQENVSASCRLHPPERCERGSHDSTAAVYGIRAHRMHNGSILPAHVCIRDDVLLRPHPQHCIGGQALGIDLFVYKPTVSLGVTSAVVSSCGHDSGHIEHRVTHELAGHWATHERPAEGIQHRHPPHAQPLAPVRQPQGRRPRLTPRGCTDHTSPSDEGHPCGRIREEQRHHRSLVPRDARPRQRSSFRLLGMASPYWITYVNY